MSPLSPDRRSVLVVAGNALAVGLAGCVGSLSDSTHSGDGQSDDHSGDDHSGDDHSGDDHSGDDHSGDDGDGGHSGDGTGDDHSNEGHDDQSDHGNALGDPVDEAEVEMYTADGEHHFEPHVVHVNSGGTVTWKLGSGDHSTTAYHPENDRPARIPEGAEAWDSGILGEGSFTHTFETEGVYDYFCTPHESPGMIGTVVVGSDFPDDSPGLQPPQEELPSGAREKIEVLNQSVSDQVE